MDRFLLRPIEAAEALGVGRSTIYGLLASGAIRSIRVGRSIRVPIEALRSWLEANASVTPARHEPGSGQWVP